MGAKGDMAVGKLWVISTAGFDGVGDLSSIWQEYDLDRFKEGMSTLFPNSGVSLEELFAEVMTGDVLGAFTHFLGGNIQGMAESVAGLKNVMIWLIVLGIVSALLTHFVEVFDKHQVADLSFYFLYLLLAAVLLKCFSQAALAAVETLENIVLFIQLLVPTYLMAVGVATGTTTVSASYQLMVLLIYGVETILIGMVIPLIYSYLMLSVVNGIWIEEKLTLLIELLEKGIGWILKAALGIVTGISVFQAVISPVIDSLKANALQKAISAIPGIGNAADGVVELVVGSAVVIKNSIGIVLLILLLILCAAPLLKIFLLALMLKGAAAFMGIVSDKRITACANHTGDAGMLLFRVTGTAMLLFLICLSIIAATTNRGF